MVHYHYDNERISDVTYTDSNDPAKAEKPLLKNIIYAPFGGPQQWTYGNGLTQKVSNDLDGRTQRIELRNGANPAIWAQSYGYDRYNNIKKIERAGSDQTKRTQQFDYDVLHRLTAEKRNDQNTEFAYDPVGNRTEAKENGNATQLMYTAGNRLTQRGDVKITLDGRGNLIEETETGAGAEAKSKTVRRFDYNSNDRPINFYKDGQLTAQYHYNANGLRDRKTLVNATQTQTKLQTKTQITQFTYAPDTRLLSAGSTTQTTHYIWLGGAPIAQIKKPVHQQQTQTTITYLHTDHLLTPRIATNEQQKVVWRWQSDAFGEALADSDPDKDGKHTNIQLRFPGQYADEESGLYYNVFRYYDPKLGRYTQSDPIGLGGGINSFSYALNNSISNFDTLGLSCTSSGGMTTCSYPGGPTFSLPTPTGFPDTLDSLFYHIYDVTRSIGCARAEDVMKGLINSPTPGNSSPATSGGTANNAVVSFFPFNNPVTSYLTKDINTGMPVVVNMTGPGSLFGPGYVARYVTDGVAHTVGEGTNYIQSPLVLGPPVQWAADEGLWGHQMSGIIEKAGCGCGNR
ncbi:MAG: Repeat family protein [Verrucomicrobiaceae bacterium]|nr:Repeat family protein [Verrucomicrobiaceae bacterium]